MILKGSSLNYSINNPGIAWCYKPPNGNETFNIILKNKNYIKGLFYLSKNII